ncbi:3-dehydroquinate synthase, partial [Arthrospira platensis SPKY1]|nr:3-dehydroquinate synthase [Arthrospira platensis SPKY1]
EPSSTDLSELLSDSASVKMTIVQQDVLESGVRAHLNLGHTFGHALEAECGYGSMLHGEAVFLGMLAADIAASALFNRPRVDALWAMVPFYAPYLPTQLPDTKHLIPYMLRDKKNQNQRIRLVLSEAVGQ